MKKYYMVFTFLVTAILWSASPVNAQTTDPCISENTARTELISLINGYRQKISPTDIKVRSHDVVQQAAEEYADYLANNFNGNGELPHDLDGKTPLDRMKTVFKTQKGKDWENGYVVENVGMGGNAKAMFDAWMASNGHRQNMRDPFGPLIGVGIACKNGKIYWVTLYVFNMDLYYY